MKLPEVNRMAADIYRVAGLGESADVDHARALLRACGALAEQIPEQITRLTECGIPPHSHTQHNQPTRVFDVWQHGQDGLIDTDADGVRTCGGDFVYTIHEGHGEGLRLLADASLSNVEVADLLRRLVNYIAERDPKPVEPEYQVDENGLPF